MQLSRTCGWGVQMSKAPVSVCRPRTVQLLMSHPRYVVCALSDLAVRVPGLYKSDLLLSIGYSVQCWRDNRSIWNMYSSG